MSRIEADRVYWVVFDQVRFKVRAVRPTTLEGWWLCKTEQDGDKVVVPEEALELDTEAGYVACSRAAANQPETHPPDAS